MRRLLSIVVVTAALLLLPALGAAAQADDPNSGTLTFTGDGRTGEIACADGVCVIADVVPVITFRDGISRETVSGTSTVDGCEYAVTSTRDLLLTADSVTGTSTIDTISYTCDDGTSGSDRAIRSDIQYSVDSGDACLIDGSCAGEGVAPTPVAPGGSSDPRPARPSDAFPAGGDRAFATPTAVSSLPSVGAALRPANLAWAAGGTVVLGVLVVIPSQFANSAADALLARLRERMRRGRMNPDVPRPGLELRGWPWAAGGVVLASALATLADPNFGFDGAGLRLGLSILVTFAIEVVLGWAAIVLLVRRTHPNAVASFSFTPLSLAFVIGAVLLSRVSGFSPPIVFGLVAGVAFGGLLATADRARVALIGLGWAFGIGVVAWIGYSLVPVDAVVVRELLGAAAIAGISTLPIALLPLRGLAGHAVWEWRKVVWITAYGVGLFAFLLVLLPLPGAWNEVGVGLWTWVALFVAYATASVGIWLLVTRPWTKDALEGQP